MRARYYSPAMERFLTRDPFPGFMTQPATLNAYAYTTNNPVLNSDPSGLIAPFVAIAGIGFAAGAVYNASQQTNGFINFCEYDMMESLAWGIGGAMAATSFAILTIGVIGMAGAGLQGIALGAFSLGIKATFVSAFWTGGMAFSGVAAVGAAWLFGAKPNIQLLVPNTGGPQTPSNRYTGMIYRNATGTASSLTPRPGEDDIPGGGLSFFNSLEKLNPGKYVAIDASKLQRLTAVLDNNPPGHVSVSPSTLLELQEWAATRGTESVHNLTQELMSLMTIGKK